MSLPDESPSASGTGMRAGVAWNFASLAILAVSGLAWTALIGTIYGPAALGVFNQVYSAYVLFSMAAAGGINYSVLRAVAEAAGDKQKVASAVTGALVPTVALAAGVSLAFWASRHWVAARFDSPGVAVGMELAAPGLFFFAVNKQLLAVVNGLQRMRAFAVYQALRYVLILGGIAVVWQLGWPGDELSFTWTFSEAVLFVLLAVEVGVQVAWRKAKDVLQWSREHFSFGARSVLSAVLLELNAKIDIWMLGILLDDTSVGIYSFAAVLAEGFYQIVNVLQNNLNPLLAGALSRGDTRAVESLVRRHRRWIVPAFAAAAVLAVIVFPWTVPILARDHPEFRASWPSFAILVGAVGALAAWLPFGNLLLMGKRPGWNSVLMSVSVLVNVAMNAALIPWLGISGAAAGTAIAFAAFVLALKLLAKRQLAVSL